MALLLRPGLTFSQATSFLFFVSLPVQRLPMKKLSRARPDGRILAIAAFLWLILGQTACKKSEAQPQLDENKAWLNLASPADDGRPVDELILDSTHETLVPINKKEGWPLTQTGSTAVSIRFVDAGKEFTQFTGGQVRHFREVYIVSFRVL
jgi:hypothetical protein